jgi:hypothetical protein
MKRTRLAVVLASVVALTTTARAQVGSAPSAPTTLTVEQALQYASITIRLSEPRSSRLMHLRRT